MLDLLQIKVNKVFVIFEPLMKMLLSPSIVCVVTVHDAMIKVSIHHN